MSERTTQKACMYIFWNKDGERHEAGPFYSISPDGSGFPICQKWTAYIVQHPNGRFERIKVSSIHSIRTK